MSKHRNIKGIRYGYIGCLFVLGVLALGLDSCTEKKLIRLSGEAQGTFFTISYLDSKGRDFTHEIDSLLEAFDNSASLWVDNSLLRQINDNLTDSLDEVLEGMISRSLEMNRYTDGAFDCRIGRLVQMWGFSFRQREPLSDAAIDSLLAIAHADIRIEGDRLVKGNPHTELDLNAIAQGYCVDMLAAWFDERDITDYLIDVGGEVIARGDKGHGRAWCVGVERPAADSLAMPMVETAVELRDCALVTSGNYRKYYEKDGVKYSHTIDPATGRPVQHSLLSVTVVDSTSWLADAMATAYMVMGLDRAKAFINEHKGEAGTSAVFFIYDSLGVMQTYATKEFERIQVTK